MITKQNVVILKIMQHILGSKVWRYGVKTRVSCWQRILYESVWLEQTGMALVIEAIPASDEQ